MGGRFEIVALDFVSTRKYTLCLYVIVVSDGRYDLDR